MFRLDIALVIESGGDQLITTTDYIEGAYRAEHLLTQLKEMRNRILKTGKDKASRVAT